MRNFEALSHAPEVRERVRQQEAQLAAEKPAEDRPSGDAADAVAPARDLGASS